MTASLGRLCSTEHCLSRYYCYRCHCHHSCCCYSLFFCCTSESLHWDLDETQVEMS